MSECSSQYRSGLDRVIAKEDIKGLLMKYKNHVVF